MRRLWRSTREKTIVRPRVIAPAKAPFRTLALAYSFRSELLTAARKGEAFDIETGRPVAMGRPDRSMSWYDFACEYVDLKWPRVAATTSATVRGPALSG